MKIPAQSGAEVRTPWAEKHRPNGRRVKSTVLKGRMVSDVTVRCLLLVLGQSIFMAGEL